MKLNWGNYITIFIGLFLTLCTIFIIFSLRQNRDLVSDNYYKDGAGYSEQMEINKRSEIYADSFNVSVRENSILILIPAEVYNKSGKLNTYFYRPSEKAFDLRRDFEVSRDSLIIDRKLLKDGRYILKLTWITGKDDYLVEKEIFIN